MTERVGLLRAELSSRWFTVSQWALFTLPRPVRALLLALAICLVLLLAAGLFALYAALFTQIAHASEVAGAAFMVVTIVLPLLTATFYTIVPERPQRKRKNDD